MELCFFHVIMLARYPAGIWNAAEMRLARCVVQDFPKLFHLILMIAQRLIVIFVCQSEYVCADTTKAQ